MLRVTPIYGSCWSPEGAAVAPQCTLVEYADCRVLLNVGWFPTSISGSHVDESFPALPPHDALILTDSSLECLGGLPLYYRQWQQQQQQQYAAEDRAALPPIFATFPVVKMGQMTIYNDHAAISLDGGEPPFTLQDVDQVFAAITAIKYSHPQKLGPAAAPTLTISAHRAGHAVGAAFYVLRGLRDDTRVVLLTSAYHMAKEVHLDSATLLQHGSTPDVLVTRPGGPALRSLQALTVGTKQRPAALPPTLVTQARRQLTEAVLQVLRREGNVLLPSDAASRALELILLLNQHWERHRLGAAYHLVWLGPMVPNIGDFARSQLEWMSASVGQAFLDSQDGKDHHPWQLQCVTQCTSVAQVLSLMQDSPNPTCVVAAGASLEAGPARDLLLQWADTPENAILLTDSAQASLRPAHVRRQAVVTATEAEASTEEDALPGRPLAPDEAISPWTTAGQLLQAWAAAQRSGDQDLDQIPVDVAVRLTQSLQGTELAAFSAREEAARQVQLEQAKQEAILREVEFAKGQLRLGEEADKKVSVVATSRPRKKSRFDQSLFLKYSKPLHCTWWDFEMDWHDRLVVFASNWFLTHIAGSLASYSLFIHSVL
jgi:cleavage and polyadenylation specificity factor subunit 2